MRCTRCYGGVVCGAGQSFSLTIEVTTDDNGNLLDQREIESLCGDCVSEDRAEELAEEVANYLASVTGRGGA